MKLFVAGLIGLGSTSAVVHADVYQTTSNWLEESFATAKEIRFKFFNFPFPNDGNYTDANCPIMDDEDFANSALPVVISNPGQYPGYTNGQPEMYLQLRPQVIYPVFCNDGTVGIITISNSDGRWKMSSLSPPGRNFYAAAIFKEFRDELAKSRLIQKNYFLINFFPITLGTTKLFGGTYLIARQTDTAFDCETTLAIPDLQIQGGQWMSADDFMIKLRVQQTP